MSLYEKMWKKLKEETSAPNFISLKGNDLTYTLWEIKELIRTTEKQVEKENVCDRCEYSELYADKYCLETTVKCSVHGTEKVFGREDLKPFGECEVVPKETDKVKTVHLLKE